jgi:hypothetical protein
VFSQTILWTAAPRGIRAGSARFDVAVSPRLTDPARAQVRHWPDWRNWAERAGGVRFSVLAGSRAVPATVLSPVPDAAGWASLVLDELPVRPWDPARAGALGDRPLGRASQVPDLHDLLTLLTPYPALLRRLGLVFELAVPVAAVAGAIAVQVVPSWTPRLADSADVSPLTRLTAPRCAAAGLDPPAESPDAPWGRILRCVRDEP